VALRLAKEPGVRAGSREPIRAGCDTIFIDEIQKIPALLERCIA
jgi:hypothetical protein